MNLLAKFLKSKISFVVYLIVIMLMFDPNFFRDVVRISYDKYEKSIGLSEKYFEAENEKTHEYGKMLLQKEYDIEDIKCKCKFIEPNYHNKECEYLYGDPKTENNNKYLFDRWLAALVLACVVLICNLGLAFYGFMSCSNFGASSI